MQYEIGLPAGYDMEIITRRVAERGTATDDYPHLALKAYAVRRTGRHGSLVNAYAPFYLWGDPAGMNSFLYGPFRSITTDFGRPVVWHGVGAAFHRGPAFGATPVFATRETVTLPADIEPGPVVAALTEPGTVVAEPGTLMTDPGPLMAEPGTLMTEPGTLMTDPGPLMAEPGTFMTEPGTFMAEPGTLADGVHSRAVAVDPQRWQALVFTLWEAAPENLDPAATAFDILHVSTPGLTGLPTGRHW